MRLRFKFDGGNFCVEAMARSVCCCCCWKSFCGADIEEEPDLSIAEASGDTVRGEAEVAGAHTGWWIRSEE